MEEISSYILKKRIDELIDERIKTLNQNKKKIKYSLTNPRRLHPAYKQTKGRILELIEIKNKIRRIPLIEMPKPEEETVRQAKYEERMRIARELELNPFRWCSVCKNIPCQCKG